MRVTNKQLSQDLENVKDSVNDLCNISENTQKVSNSNSYKIRRVVTKVNKLQKQIDDITYTYNDNLAKHYLRYEQVYRLCKICFGGLIFLGLLLIACI